MNESKYLKTKLVKMNKQKAQEEEACLKQQEFLEKLEARYAELCGQVGKEIDYEFTKDEMGVTVKALGKKPTAPPKKRKIDNVSDYWQNDHPDRFEVTLNQKHFEQLKEKVLLLKRSDRLKEKQHKSKINGFESTTQQLEKEEAQLSKPKTA